MEARARKKRSDRTHYVYLLRFQSGDTYIGITARTESTAMKSVMTRFAKHWYRAFSENKTWALCQALRQCKERSEVEVCILDMVRGKAEGHKREVELRRALKPTLNTDCRGD